MRHIALGSWMVAAVLGATLSAQTVYHKGDDGVVMPRAVRLEKARYTGEALRNRIEGTASIEVVVHADGTLSEPRVVTSLDTAYGLDDEALKAVRQSEFRPGTKDGKPVDVQVNVEIQFILGR